MYIYKYARYVSIHQWAARAHVYKHSKFIGGQHSLVYKQTPISYSFVRGEHSLIYTLAPISYSFVRGQHSLIYNHTHISYSFVRGQHSLIYKHSNPGLHQKSQTRSQTVVSHDLKFPTSNQPLDTRFDVGLTSIRRLRFQTRVMQSAAIQIHSLDGSAVSYTNTHTHYIVIRQRSALHSSEGSTISYTNTHTHISHPYVRGQHYLIYKHTHFISFVRGQHYLIYKLTQYKRKNKYVGGGKG